jgi:TldD protein
VSEPELLSAHQWGEVDRASAETVMSAVLADAQTHGAEFCDVRLSETEELRLYAVSNQAPDERLEGHAGLGVRVLVDGVWGFASQPLRGDSDAQQAVAAAIANAKAASNASTERLTLSPREAEIGFYQTDAVIDPFAVSPSEREAMVLETLAAALEEKHIVRAQAGVNAKRQHRFFASSDGSLQEQHFVESGGMVLCVAANDRVVQRRSYPNSFHGNTAAAGWEFVVGLDLVREASRVGAEAAQLLKAPVVSSGHSSLVIGPAQMALQIHESTGHAIELDRILGDEANFAGRSFITRDAIGKLQYGSEAVTIMADATVRGTRGSFMFDDEGTRTAPTTLIDEGMVANFLSGRDSAAREGTHSTGAGRSDGWAYLPLNFATNVFLAPGEGSTDELLERMGDGYYIDDNRSWSIDSTRWNFQFGTEVAWEVRNGKKTRLVRDFSYGGLTPEFWGSVEAVAGPEEFRTFGMPCGKGEPKQWGFLSHGAAPTLVRNVRIGVS